MGSLGEHAKGQQPMLDRIRQHNRDYNNLIYMERAMTILANMARENDRRWWEFWKPRWFISDEPLRNDAQNLIRDIACDLVGKVDV